MIAVQVHALHTNQQQCGAIGTGRDFPVHVLNVVTVKPDFQRDGLLLLFPLCHVGTQMERKRSSTGALGMFKIAQPICVPPRWPVTPRPAGSAIARGQGAMMPGKKLIQGQLS